VNQQFGIKEYPVTFHTSDGAEFTSTKGLDKTRIIARVAVDDPKEISGVITFLSSPVFRNKVEAKKAELGITNYGMDNGHTYPIKVKDKDGVDVVVAYERDIKLTRSI
jgi:hypothetical protein